MIKMTNLKILFLHGLESKPGGTKPTALSLEGHTVLNPSLPKDSFDESVSIAQNLVDSEAPDVIVGSSRGGAVAMAVNAAGARKVLVAPAWKKYGLEGKVDSGTIILHSESDDVVSFADTQEVFRNSVGANVIACDDDHRMSSPSTLARLSESVKKFL